MYCRIIFSLVSVGLMSGCSATSERFADSASSPANPTAAESPFTQRSHTLDVAAGSPGSVIRPAAAESNGMKGMDMPGMGGMNMPGMTMGQESSTQTASQPATTQAAFYFTCVMHPQIHQDHGGKCPICGMELIKKDTGTEVKGGGQ